MRAMHVLGEDHRVESVPGVVGHRDDVLLAGKRMHNHNGTEDFFATYPSVDGCVDDDGGFDDPTVTHSTGHHSTAIFIECLKVTAHLGEVFLAGERPEVGIRILRITYLHLLGLLGKQAHELVVNRFLNVQTTSRKTDLTRVAEDGLRCPVDSISHVGIVEHDVGALASQLQADRGQVRRCSTGNHFPRRTIPGEGDPIDALVMRQCLSNGVGAVAVNNVEHARRDPRLCSQPGPDGRGNWGVFGRLQNNGVSPGERRGDLPGAQHQGEVPGGDRHHNPSGAELRVGVVPGIHRIGVRCGHPCVIGEEAHIPCTPLHIVPSLADGLAHIASVRAGELIDVLHQQIGHSMQNRLPFCEAQARPHAGVERLAGSSHSALRVGG